MTTWDKHDWIRENHKFVKNIKIKYDFDHIPYIYKLKANIDKPLTLSYNATNFCASSAFLITKQKI